jgi:hypothetical protein
MPAVRHTGDQTRYQDHLAQVGFGLPKLPKRRRSGEAKNKGCSKEPTANCRDSGGLGWRARVSARQFPNFRSWIGGFQAPVSGRHSPISVAVCRRPVRHVTETGLPRPRVRLSGRGSSHRMPLRSGECDQTLPRRCLLRMNRHHGDRPGGQRECQGHENDDLLHDRLLFETTVRRVASSVIWGSWLSAQAIRASLIYALCARALCDADHKTHDRI